MTDHHRDRMRQAADRADRLAIGDDRLYIERVADAATYLADTIEAERESHERLPTWGLAMNYLVRRARTDWHYTTGMPLPIEDDHENE